MPTQGRGHGTQHHASMPQKLAPKTGRTHFFSDRRESFPGHSRLFPYQFGFSLAGAEQQAETTLEQLGLDSLGRMELTLAVEQRFGFSGSEAPVTLGELWLLAEGFAEQVSPRPAPAAWFRPPTGIEPPEIVGETLSEAFVHRALAHPNDVAVADDLAGVVAYGHLLVGVLTLARRFKDLPGARVGLMLPASVACDTALLALNWAGKVPVMLNWTTGPGGLAHAVRAMELTHIVTSHQFLDRIGVQIEGAQCVCLEDVRKTIGRWEQVRLALKSNRGYQWTWQTFATFAASQCGSR